MTPSPPRQAEEDANVDKGAKLSAGIDVIEKSVGTLGRWQIGTSLVVCIVKFPVAWHQLSIVFLAPPVSFTCGGDETEKCASNCQRHEFNRTVFTETIVTQWDLVCEKGQLANLAQMITMLGILVGNMLFGYLSDRYGRRRPMIGAVLLQVLSGTCTALVPWFPAFLLLRFLTASAIGGVMVTSFVLIMEIVGLKWRTTFGILYQIPFTLGHLTLPLFAYFIRDWRSFQIAISLPTVLLVSYYWVLPESPRWLLSVGKNREALAVLVKAATCNGLPTADLEAHVEDYVKAKRAKDDNAGGNILDLFRTPIIRSYTVCLGFNWFACGLCFFGGSQYVGQLGGDIFVNVALSAVIGLPSTLFSLWSVRAFGRRRTLIFSNIVAGASGLFMAVVPPEPTWLRTTLSGFDMFGLAISFPTVYIYSGELFPTVLRNIGVGTSSMFARVGSMAAPFVAGLVLVRDWLPPLVFGVVPLIGALLCLRLPETLDCKLPDTVEEAEQLAHKKAVEV